MNASIQIDSNQKFTKLNVLFTYCLLNKSYRTELILFGWNEISSGNILPECTKKASNKIYFILFIFPVKKLN